MIAFTPNKGKVPLKLATVSFLDALAATNEICDGTETSRCYVTRDDLVYTTGHCLIDFISSSTNPVSCKGVSSCDAPSVNTYDLALFIDNIFTAVDVEYSKN